MLLDKCDVCGHSWEGWQDWVVSASTNPKQYEGHGSCLFPEEYEFDWNSGRARHKLDGRGRN